MIPYEERKPRKGRTARDIAERVGLSVRQVQNWTSEPREVYLSRAEQRREAIRALHTAEPNLSMRAIGQRLGCSAATVCRALNEGQPAH